MTKRSFLILKTFILLIFLIQNITAQSDRIKHEKYFFEQGLSQSQINCIARDSTGYLWFGTQDGLNRFDGHDFKVYRNDPENSGTISNNYIHHIYVDEDNSLWAATHGGGLNKLNKFRTTFSRYLIKGENTTEFNQNIITFVFPGDKNNLIIGTEGYGLFIFNKKTDQFLKVINLPDESRTISKVIRLNTQNFLIGTNKGIFILDWQKKEIIDRRNSLLGNQFIESICAVSDGSILVGTLSGFVYQMESADKYRGDIKIKDIYNDGSSVWAITENEDKSIWIGTESDLILLPHIKSGSGKISELFRSSVQSYPYRTKCLYKDPSGILWIGTAASGIIKTIIKPEIFKQITFAEQLGLQDNSTWYVFKDNSDLIWMGTDGYGLIQYDRVKDQYKRWTNQPGNSISLSHNSISFIMQDKRGDLWISTFGGGINKLTKNGSFEHLQNNPRDSNSLVHDYVWCMLEDFRGNIWAGTKKGLDRYNPYEKTFTHFQHNTDDTNSLGNNLVLTLFEDSEKNIWIGTYGGGLNKYDTRKQIFTVYKCDPDDQSTISDNSIMSIDEDSKGNLWIGTDIGLNKLDKKTGKFTRFFEKDGLLNEMIYAAAVDEKDIVWVSTNRGISAFDTEKMIFRNYNMSDGLLSDEFNQSACYKAYDGEIFFAGINGVNSFYPENLNFNIKSPKIVIDKIMLFNNEIPPERYLENNRLEISYYENYLQFEFAALEFADPDKNIFKYKLEGFNQEWIYAGNRRFAIFSNLDPGNYRLRITTALDGGVWDESGIVFDLTVLPPYWQTWWFRVLATVILVSIAYVIFKIRITRLLEIERLRLQIASDLHDEIGSSLSSIAVQTQMLGAETDKKKLESKINMIGELTRDVIGIMSDIIWSIDSRNDSLKDLISRIQNFSFNLFNDSSIEINYDIHLENPQKKIRPHIRQNLYLIIKEALNNIFKHSGASSAAVKIRETSNKIEIAIHDDGRGLDTDRTYPGNGLRNMRMRAERINADIEFISSNGLKIKLTVENI